MNVVSLGAAGARQVASGRFTRRPASTALSAELYQAAFAHAPTGAVVLTADGCLIGYNAAFSRLVGQRRTGAYAVPGEDVTLLWPSLFDEAVLYDEGRSHQRQFVRDDGTVSIVQVSVALAPASEDEDAVLIAQLHCITEMAREQVRLRQLAERDSLTGLLNRRKLVDELTEQIDRLVTHGEQAALAVIDLNGFKDINDRAGHAQGDLVLQAVAMSLRRCVQVSDEVARLGGDEFAVLLRGASADTLEDWGVALTEAIAMTSLTTPVTAGVGVTALEFGDQPIDTLRRADDAMYQAKRAEAGRFLNRSRSGAEKPQRP